MPIVIAILLGLSALLIVIYPLLGLDSAAATGDAGSDALADVAERERSAKMALRDVDFDYRLGNLEENDYEALRTRYEGRALAALRTRYEREQALDRLIDEQLAAMQNKKIGKNGNLAAASAKSARASVGVPPAKPARPANNGHRADAGQSGNTSAEQNADSGKNGNQISPLPMGEGSGVRSNGQRRPAGQTRSRRRRGA